MYSSKIIFLFSGLVDTIVCASTKLEKNKIMTKIIEVLFDKKILHNHSDPQTAKNFGIKNSKRLRHYYHTNENKHPITNYGVPKGYEMIEEAVEGALEMTDTTPIRFTS